MWTAKNEINSKWNYVKAWDMMWINKTEVAVEQQLSYPDFTPLTQQAEIKLEFIQ